MQLSQQPDQRDINDGKRRRPCQGVDVRATVSENGWFHVTYEATVARQEESVRPRSGLCVFCPVFFGIIARGMVHDGRFLLGFVVKFAILRASTRNTDQKHTRGSRESRHADFSGNRRDESGESIPHRRSRMQKKKVLSFRGLTASDDLAVGTQFLHNRRISLRLRKPQGVNAVYTAGQFV